MVNGKDQLDIMKAVPMEGTYNFVCVLKRTWMVSLLIVESGNGSTVEGTLATVKQLHLNCRNQ